MLYGCGGKEIKRVAKSEPREKERGRDRKIDEERGGERERRSLCMYYVQKEGDI